jgi:hypothetical protein
MRSNNGAESKNTAGSGQTCRVSIGANQFLIRLGPRANRAKKGSEIASEVR